MRTKNKVFSKLISSGIKMKKFLSITALIDFNASRICASTVRSERFKLADISL